MTLDECPSDDLRNLVLIRGSGEGSGLVIYVSYTPRGAPTRGSESDKVNDVNLSRQELNVLNCEPTSIHNAAKVLVMKMTYDRKVANNRAYFPSSCPRRPRLRSHLLNQAPPQGPSALDRRVLNCTVHHSDERPIFMAVILQNLHTTRPSTSNRERAKCR